MCFPDDSVPVSLSFAYFVFVYMLVCYICNLELNNVDLS